MPRTETSRSLSIEVSSSLGEDHSGPLGSRHHLQRVCSPVHSGATASHSRLAEVRVHYSPYSTRSSYSPSRVFGRTSGQRGDRTGGRLSVPRLLQSHVLGHQKEHVQVEAHHQSQEIEWLPGHSIVPDGDYHVRRCGSPTRRLGNLFRPDRCVFPHTHSSVVQEVSPDRRQRETVPVSSPSIRALYITPGLHQDAGTSGSVSPLQRHSFSPLSGRLPDQVSVTTTLPRVDPLCSGSFVRPGPGCQSREVGPCSFSDFQVHRHSLPHPSGPHAPPGRSSDQNPGSGQRAPLPAFSSVPVDVIHRTPGLSGKAGPVRSYSYQTNPLLSTSPVSSRSPPVGSADPGGLGSCRGNHMVVQRVQPREGSTSRAVPFGSRPVHGRLPEELGGVVSRFSGFGRVDSGGISPLNQCARTASGPEDPTVVRQRLGWLEDPRSLRQLDDSGICQQSGRHQVPDLSGHSVRPLSSCSAERYYSARPTHSGQTESGGGPPFTEGRHSQHRVDPMSSGDSRHMVDMGHPSYRPDGNVVQQPASGVRESLSGLAGASRRRNVLVLGQDGRVHLSALGDDPGSTDQAADTSVLPDSDPSSVAQSALVSVATPVSNRLPPTPSAASRHHHHAAQRSDARSDSVLGSARMSSIVDQLRDQGFSAEVSQRIAKGGRGDSTHKLYDSKWQKFTFWCHRRSLDPFQASVSDVANFFNFLFVEEGLAPVTIEGYRSTIDSVWSASNRSLVGVHAIQQLFASFKAERPRPIHRVPKWDLGLVLRFLREPQFHPTRIEDSPMLFSQKTVFLTLLALARRCSEVHALDPHRVSVTPRSVIIPPFPGFLPKIRSTAEGAERYLPMVIRKLSVLTDDPEELLLCPARTLLAYHEWAKKRCPNRDRFFVTTSHLGHAVEKATISSWVKKLIRSAYAHAETSSDALALASTGVHEVRAIASSLAIQSTFALRDVLAAAQWTTPSVFASYYLCDISAFEDQFHSLGPLIIAEKWLG